MFCPCVSTFQVPAETFQTGLAVKLPSAKVSWMKTTPAWLAAAAVIGYCADSFLRSARKLGSAALAVSAFLMRALRSVTSFCSFWSLVWLVCAWVEPAHG